MNCDADMIIVLMESKMRMRMVKKKWQEAKYGGNDGWVHLEANMSAQSQPANTGLHIEKAEF